MLQHSGTSIPLLIDTATRYRNVRLMHHEFLRRWSISPGGQAEQAAIVDERLCDPCDRDWSLLYRGSVLDD